MLKANKGAKFYMAPEKQKMDKHFLSVNLLTTFEISHLTKPYVDVQLSFVCSYVASVIKYHPNFS